MMRTWQFLTLALLACGLHAASTATWEMNTYGDFLKGKFQGIALSRDGRLMLAPEVKPYSETGQPAVWSVVQGPNGELYLGTGHGGQVHRVDKSGDSTAIWTADEAEVFALAIDRQGVLYAGTSPQGKVYRIEKGKATEFFNPGTTYIWSLRFDDEGSLFVGTGDEGKIFKVNKNGSGELYYETGQVHVTCLELDANGELLAGTEPNGILYRINSAGRAFVIYDANLPEIRALAPQPDGTIYVAALGGSVAKRAATALLAPSKTQRVTATGTSITISAAQGGLEITQQPGEQEKTKTTPVASALPMIEVSGVEKSALFRINADNTVEKLWSSTEENAYDLHRDGDKIIFSTDREGRLYELENDGKVRLLAQTNESDAVRLLPAGQDLLVATGNMGKLFRVTGGLGAEGVYHAPVHDAARIAQWGRLSWTEGPGGTGAVSFQTRTGNSARPDKTWSDWSTPLTDSLGSAIPSPSARYVQWRMKLAGAKGKSPVVESVTLAYLPQNSPPKVSGVVVSSKASESNGNGSSSTNSSSSTAAYSITVTDTGEEGASTVSGTSTQRLTRTTNDEIHVTWQTEDLDGDKLIHSLWFRGEGEREWKCLKDDLEDTTYKIDSDALADGRYYFRVESSDRLTNPPERARTGKRVSAPVLIDHTPPVLAAKPPKRTGDRVEIEFEATDAASPLKRCEYSVDAGRWLPVAAVDGIVDSPRERFLLRLEELPEGEHIVVVRVYDSAQNAGLSKTVLR